MCDYLNIPHQNLIIPHQIHQSQCLVIDQGFVHSSKVDKKELLEGKDALITNLSNVCICISTADCIPILLYDLSNKVIACVHAGWRGTAMRIISKVLNEMEKHYGTEPSRCKAVIGPGISLKNFEVGDEVYDLFMEKGFPMNRVSKRYNKWHIDLPECNRVQLLECGVEEESIQSCGICTYDNCQDYFSARRLGINSGRILTGIIMNA